MVKPDVKHNYYADLDLPTSASIDDIRKQYRKLALQYHPDRNSGKEEECVPKFQAIQAANEVLGDANTKQKYDTDRRKAGLYPTIRPNQPAPGNPYTANSAYPPPPRRTQPGTWQRPPPAAAAAGGTPGGMPNGADRFSNFPRPSPTARKDPPPDRTNMFRAWQNMNSAQDRQQRFAGPPPGSQPQQQPPQPPPQPPPPPPQERRPRPQPPPRQAGQMPTEEQIRAGMRHKGAPPPMFDGEGVDQRQAQWSAFQQQHAGKPGMARSNTFKMPRKGGFNPNAPSSDEKPAPSTGAHYVHRNKSADFGRPRPGQKMPPPPPGPPPPGMTPTSPLSPNSPTFRRPFADPTSPFKSRPPGDQAPYVDANRKSTPYSSYLHEKTEGPEQLRRSHSVRDNTKLGPDEATDRSRARSQSPLRTTKTHQEGGTRNKPFDIYSSSSASDEDMAQTPEDQDSSTTSQDRQRPGTAPNADRPKKVPTPPSSRVNGGIASSPSMPRMPHVNGGPTDGGSRSDSEQPGMQQKTKSNMYAYPNPSSLFDSRQWTAQMFGSYSTSRAGRAPHWAIPSLNPSSRRKARIQDHRGQEPGKESYVTAADDVFLSASTDQKNAYYRFQSELNNDYGYIPNNTDMSVFLMLASIARQVVSCGDTFLDRLLARVLLDFPTVGYSHTNVANERLRANHRFAFPRDHDLFTPTNAKSRSEENINTRFSPEGWTATFTGAPEYFAPPQSTTGSDRKISPNRRPTSSSSKGVNRAATFDIPPPTSTPRDEVPSRPWGSDGYPKDIPVPNTAPGEVRFSKEDWEKTFQDASWTWPPPPPKPPSPVRGMASATGGRRASQGGRRKSRSKQSTAGARTPQPAHMVDEDDMVEVQGADGRPESGAPVNDEPEAMDIDTPPGAQQEANGFPAPTSNEKEARFYSVPPSTLRQQQVQGEQTNGHRKTSSTSRRAQRAFAGGEARKLNTNLDDLRNVEPIARTADPTVGGLNHLADMGSTLPFQSQASSQLPTHLLVPRRLEMPQVPKPPEVPQKLTKASWHAYTESFGGYLQAFHVFNDTILRHFLARETQAEARFKNGYGWLEAMGDTTQGQGFGGYLQNVREDQAVREAWSLGCEKHAEAVKGFERMRERVRKLVQGGALVDV